MPIDHDLLRKMTKEPLDPTEWKRLLRQHEAFLSELGLFPWAGDWTVLEVGGLPLAVWKSRGDSGISEAGEQLNLNLANLEGLPLSFENLSCTAFPGAQATGQNFRGSELSNSLFTDAMLDDANFSIAKIKRSDFSRASLRRADFRKALLLKTDFENCDLREADFRNATITDCDFDGANTEGALGLTL